MFKQETATRIILSLIVKEDIFSNTIEVDRGGEFLIFIYQEKNYNFIVFIIIELLYYR